MLKDIAEILPKSAALGVVLWGAISYFVLAPNIATRVAEVDLFPACRTYMTENIERIRGEQLAAANSQAGDPMQDMALSQAKALFSNPLMQALGELSGSGNMASAAIAQAEAKLAAAREASEKATAQINAHADTQMKKRDGLCGCIADRTYSKSRNEFALYAGTLGFIKLPAVENFGGDIHRAAAEGVCLVPQERGA